MNANVKAIADALDALRAKLIATPRTTEGFGEMRSLYLELTESLITAGEKRDEDLAAEVASAAKSVAEEWASNKEKFDPWQSLLKPIVGTVGAFLGAAGLGNPLALLLP
jgi:hypothetical protein